MSLKLVGNRSSRRKQIQSITTAVLKNRVANHDKAMSKKPFGILIILTTHMIALGFGRWTWTLMDRRLK